MIMAILAQCPVCRKKQSTPRKVCVCGHNLDKAKRSKKVKFWIDYRLPGGQQRRELIGISIEEARDAEGKRRAQKRENRIFDILVDSKITFKELTSWYLSLESVKKLASYNRVKLAINNFNDIFGSKQTNSIKPVDIENYQTKREKDGRSAATIDMEVKLVQTAVSKAFDNDIINGQALRAFRKVKRKLKKGSNARKRILTVDEYLKLKANSPSHLKAMIDIAYNTGMRAGEIRTLRWSYIDKERKFIQLPAKAVKESKAKTIPINHHVRTVLDGLPRALHHDFVITFRGKPIKQKDGYKRSFGTACKKADIPCGRKTPNGITFHDLRRSVKTNMLSAGVSKVYCDLILGHSLQGMDAHYIVPDDDTLKQAMERYTNWLDNKIANSLANVDQNVDHEEKKG
jgi:integrase